MFSIITPFDKLRVNGGEFVERLAYIAKVLARRSSRSTIQSQAKMFLKAWRFAVR